MGCSIITGISTPSQPSRIVRVSSFTQFCSNSKFYWNENLFNTHSMETLEKAYDTSGQFHASLEIFEALYLHTHMRIQHFDILKLKSFYDANNFNYAHLVEHSSKQTTVSL